VLVDGSVVNVGLSAIRGAFGANAGQLQWVVNAYLLPLSALLLLGGAAGDRFGRNRVLVFAVLAFGASSVLCAAAQNLAWFLAARASQGVAAAFMLPNSLAVLGETYSGRARANAIAIWAAAGSAVSALGPVVGGELIDAVGWRAIFLVNIPLSLATVWSARASVKEPSPTGHAPKLDYAGAALATLGLGVLSYALTSGTGSAGWSISSLSLLAIGGALLIAFVFAEFHQPERAMLPLPLLKSKAFVGLSLFTLLVYGVFGGLLVLVPYVLINAASYSATAAGSALLPIPIVVAVLSPVVGRLSSPLSARVLLTLGPVIVAAGFVFLPAIAAGSYWTHAFPFLMLTAIGMSCVAAPLTTAVLQSADARDEASASGFNSAVSRMGGLIATALLGSVFALDRMALAHELGAVALAGAAVSLLGAASAWFFLKPMPAPEGAAL
jgi:EmrB/QacA subfamily drug resistance transporter